MRNSLKILNQNASLRNHWKETDGKLEVAEHKPKIKDEKTELQASLAERSLPAMVSLFSSTPGGAAMSVPSVKESSLNFEATPFNRALLTDRVY